MFVWLQGSCWEWLSSFLAEQSDGITRRQRWTRYCLASLSVSQCESHVTILPKSVVLYALKIPTGLCTLKSLVVRQNGHFSSYPRLFFLLRGWEWRSLSWWIAFALEPMFSYYLPFISPSPASTLAARYLTFMADFDSPYGWRCLVPHRLTSRVGLHCHIAWLLSFLSPLKALGIT